MQNAGRYQFSKDTGGILWRNNVGATQDSNGNFFRYGLANDSAAINKKLKSADCIGIKPVLISPAMVGHTVGQFVSHEYKRVGWKFTGTEREKAQQAWADLINAMGGDAKIISGVIK